MRSDQAHGARMQLWQSAARYRRLSTLLGEDENLGPVVGLARSIEMQLSVRAQLSATAQDLGANTEVLLAAIDTLVARATALLVAARDGISEPLYRADDMREESRLCIEEAEAAEEKARKRSLSARAFSLAQLAEAVERANSAR